MIGLSHHGLLYSSNFIPISDLIIHPIIYSEHHHTDIPIEYHIPPPSYSSNINNIGLDYSSHYLVGMPLHRYTNTASYSSTLLFIWSLQYWYTNRSKYPFTLFRCNGNINGHSCDWYNTHHIISSTYQILLSSHTFFFSSFFHALIS